LNTGAAASSDNGAIKTASMMVRAEVLNINEVCNESKRKWDADAGKPYEWFI
jgi:hypothetical protein